MSKRVNELTVEELDRLAAEAWLEASQSALKAGVSVVGRDRGKIVRRHADGRTEVLSEAAPPKDVEQITDADRGESPPNDLKRARDIA